MKRSAGSCHIERSGGALLPILALIVLAGCARQAAGPPATLLTLIDPARIVADDSDLLPDSVKAALRSYLSRREDSVWVNVESLDIAQLAGFPGALTGSLNEAALPGKGDTAVVRVEVPGLGHTEFLLTLTYTDIGPRRTYTGHTPDRAMSIVFRRDTVVVGRIDAATGAFSFRSGSFGLLNIFPDDVPDVLAVY
ncbi:MAG: hypothetical protein ACRELT_05435 [Longimicrobiales bacterium]